MKKYYLFPNFLCLTHKNLQLEVVRTLSLLVEIINYVVDFLENLIIISSHNISDFQNLSLNIL